MSNEETTPCKWCSEPTRMLGTCECDNCHEIAMRVRRLNPGTLRAILEAEAPEVLKPTKGEA